jgi:hypothetical protein
LIAELHGCAGGAFGNVSPDTVSAARAELAAKDAEIERLREALEHAASYMVTLCMDRPVHEGGEVVGHWQTVDWLIGLRELAEESHSIALSSLPPSDMRLVPVERLREIEWQENDTSVNEPDSCPACKRYRDRCHAPDCWLGNALRDAENRV